MEKDWFTGDVSDLAFPYILFQIWREKLTGNLEVKTDPPSSLTFKNGDICVLAEQIQNSGFISRLKSLSTSTTARRKNARTIQDLLEHRHFAPDELWQTLRSLVIGDVTALFDFTSAPYAFQNEGHWEEHEILFYIPVPDLILDGIRGMTNTKLIEAQFQEEDQSLKLLFPEYLQRLPLSAPEIYLYHVVKKQSSVQAILASSQLGKSATRRILYAFLALGIAGLPRTAVFSGKGQDISQSDIYHLMEGFNRTFAYIYKYISKEIGPASLNVLEKCLEETKPSLSSLFQNFRFDREGRIEISSVPITSASVQGRELKQTLLQDLNEILAAEILAVKRILGNVHEAALVKNLGRINGWN
jgi:hypothetical protein